jgi:hypothetical protein
MIGLQSVSVTKSTALDPAYLQRLTFTPAYGMVSDATHSCYIHIPRRLLIRVLQGMIRWINGFRSITISA